MNYKKSNMSFTAIVIFHIAVIGLLILLRNVYSMGVVENLLISELILVLPAGTVFLLSGEKKKNAVLGFHKLKITTILMIVLFSLMITPLMIVVNAISMLFVDNEVSSMTPFLLTMPFPVVWFMMGIFGPFCEELVFRGIIYKGYLKSGNIWKAVLLSSLLFGLVHMNFNQAPYAFVVGVAMALLVEATGSLWSSVLVHVIINSNSVFQMYILEHISPGYSLIQSQEAVNKQQLLMGISLYAVIALVTTAIAGCILVWLTKNQGRERYMSWLLGEGKDRKARVWSPALIVGIVLCLGFMLVSLFT